MLLTQSVCDCNFCINLRKRREGRMPNYEGFYHVIIYKVDGTSWSCSMTLIKEFPDHYEFVGKNGEQYGKIQKNEIFELRVGKWVSQ